MNAPTFPNIIAMANVQLNYTITELAAKLALLDNSKVKPEKGCVLIDAELGGNKVRVEYEYEREEQATEDCPGSPSLVTLQCYWHAGSAFDLDSISKKQIHAWEELCYADAEKRIEREADQAAEAQWERRMEQAAEYAA